jgi:hypothetical protein
MSCFYWEKHTFADREAQGNTRHETVFPGIFDRDGDRPSWRIALSRSGSNPAALTRNAASRSQARGPLAWALPRIRSQGASHLSRRSVLAREFSRISCREIVRSHHFLRRKSDRVRGIQVPYQQVQKELVSSVPVVSRSPEPVGTPLLVPFLFNRIY